MVDQPPLLELLDIGVTIDGAMILNGVDWTIHPGEQWAVVGPNGGGKSTLVAIAGLHRHPSSGSVSILGQTLGRIDIRPLRGRIGTSSAVLANQLRGGLTAGEVVRCGRFGALEPFWHVYEATDYERADDLLNRVGLAGMGAQTFGSLSSGERQRCLLARALMPDPELLLLDEPTAGLDLGGREQLVDALINLAETNGPVTALVTHHVEDIPPTTTHVLAIAGGQSVAAGPIDQTLSSELLSELYSMAIELNSGQGRWTAKAART